MSYTKREWATGNVVGAVDLNRIENGIADIDVDEIRGWSTQNMQLFSETVTTTDTGEGYAYGEFLYGSLLSAQTIKVTFNGTDYTVNRSSMNGTYYYGEVDDSAPSFVNYPFFINSFEDAGSVFNRLLTASAGTYTVAVSEREAVASDDFSEAVNMAVEPLISAIPTPFFVTLGTTTWGEVWDAMQNSKAAFVIKNNHIVSQPVVFEPIIYIIRSGYKIHSIGTNSNGDGVELKTYSASSFDGVLQ